MAVMRSGVGAGRNCPSAATLHRPEVGEIARTRPLPTPTANGRATPSRPLATRMQRRPLWTCYTIDLAYPGVVLTRS